MNRLSITNGWTLKELPGDFNCDTEAAVRELGSGKWLKCARFPAQAQDVLLHNGVIEFPWLPGRAAEYTWIAERSWLYHVTFECSEPGLKSFLDFSGLDTVCEVCLNGENILNADDCFVPWEAEVTGKLKAVNELFVFFPSVKRLLDENKIPANWDRRFKPTDTLRKMRQEFSRYLGPNPYFIRVGIYGGVALRQYGAAAITDMRLRVGLNAGLNKGTVRYELSGFAEKGTRVSIGILYEGTLCNSLNTDTNENGGFTLNGVLELPDPKLWWPKGHGAQPLYKIEVRVEADGKVLDSACRVVGFRRIVSSEPYRFIINNRHITLMGGNLAPLDSTTLCWNRERMNALLDLAENAHFNVLRLWGNAGPCDDHFYDECDKRGFLVWRDFNTSDMIPEDGRYAECFLREAEYHVPRLMHRPCILLWCGGNENYLWASRGNYRPGSYIGRKTLLKMKEICNRLDPDRYFVESSPDLGAFPNDPQGGNTHGYTNLWFVPGYDYLRFATEDTRISAPGLKTLKRFMRPEEIWPADHSPLRTYTNRLPWPNSWMPYTTAASERKTGPVEEFYDADNPEELVWQLGTASGLYYRRTIEKFRRGRPSDRPDMPRNSEGYIFWKLNDSWPQIYSGKVDYFLEPYIAYYHIRRAYRPLALSFDIGSYIYAWIINDTPEDFYGELAVGLFDTVKNTFVQELRRNVAVKAGDSAAAVSLDEFKQFDRNFMLYAALYDIRGDMVVSHNDFAEIERRLVFPDADVNITVNGDMITLTADKFAHAVELSGERGDDGFGWVFEDNYFDIMPGEIKTVRMLKRKEHGAISAKPHYSSAAARVNV